MEKRVIIKHYDVNCSSDRYDHVDVNMILVHDNNGETHTYEFEGYDVSIEEWEKCQTILTEHEGVIPLEPARKLWDLLVANCRFDHNVENHNSLWG